MKRVAVIDTGTNSTRLLVADVEDGRVRDLDRRTVITRLGEGVDIAGHLSRDARGRVEECVDNFARIIAEYQPSTTVLLATSSVRDAVDGEEFIAETAQIHSFGYRILSGEEEAGLGFSGVISEIPPGLKILIFDVGGGSTEVVIGKETEITVTRSLRLGCVRLKERFFSEDPSSNNEIMTAGEYVDRIIGEEIDKKDISGIDRAVGVAGTVTSLAAIDLRLESYDRDKVHGHQMTIGKVEELLNKLACMPLEERINIPVMESGRADVIVPGALIVWRLLCHTGLSSFYVSERDILDGAALAVAEGNL